MARHGGHSECEGVGRGGCIHRQRQGGAAGRSGAKANASVVGMAVRPQLAERARAEGLAARGVDGTAQREERQRLRALIGEDMAAREWQGEGFYDESADQSSGGPVVFYERFDPEDWRRPITDMEAEAEASRLLAHYLYRKGALKSDVIQMVKDYHTAARWQHMIAGLITAEQEQGGYNAGADLDDDDDIKYSINPKPKDARESWSDDNAERLARYGFDRTVTIAAADYRHFPHIAQAQTERRNDDGTRTVHLGWLTAQLASDAHNAAYAATWARQWANREGEMLVAASDDGFGAGRDKPGSEVFWLADAAWEKWAGSRFLQLPDAVENEIKERFTARFNASFEQQRDELFAEKDAELHDVATTAAESRADSDAEYGERDSDVSDTALERWEDGGYAYALAEEGWNKEQVQELFDNFSDQYTGDYDNRFTAAADASAGQAELDGERAAYDWVARRRGESGEDVAEEVWRRSGYARGDLHEDTEIYNRAHDAYIGAFADRYRELGGEDEDDEEGEEGEEDDKESEEWREE